jgi:prepilin-type N-terminal cleavage/methylation domain-containing protein
VSYAERGAARRRAGFTLVELAVALVIAGILTTVVYRLVQSQSRFVAVQSAREEAQQNARGALDILAGELRTINPDGLIRAEAQALEFMLPKAWGVVCSHDDLGTQLDVVFPDLPADAFVLGASAGVLVDTASGDSARWAPQATVAAVGRAIVTDTTRLVPGTAGGFCPEARSAGTVTAYRLTGTNFPTPRRIGNMVMLYQLVRYDVGTSDGRAWVMRSNGVSLAGTFSQQPLAGPLVHADSLRFTYYRGVNATQVTPGTTTATLRDVSRVRIRLAMEGRNRVGGLPQKERDSVTVLLRNRTRRITP